MDSNSPEILPPVHVEQPDTLSSSDNKGTSAEKGERAAGERPSPAGPGSVAPSFIAQPKAGAPSAASTPPTSSVPSASHTTNLIADDTDLIEKQWVIKAKEIIDKTKHDPRLQNNEINKVRSDYMYKRYGKEIKIPED